MKILLTLPRPLFPADTGGKIRSLNIFSRLAQRVEIHALSFADPISDAMPIREMKAMFESYTTVPWHEATKYSPGFYFDVLARQFSSLPYFLAKCDGVSFRRAVKSLLAHHGFDVVLCDFLHTAALLLDTSFTPKVMFEHNVEFLLRKRKYEMVKQPLKKFVFGMDWKKTRMIEGMACRSYDHVLTVSPEDKQTLVDEFAIDHISVVPTGVDTDFFRPTEVPPQPGKLVFVGSMDWDPNEDGMLWFLREVYPKICRAVPYVSLSIVGRNPSYKLRSIAAREPAVEITGRVPDVRPYVSAAEVVVVPLQVGGGTRIKIPEAMAMAKPIVSTQIGAEGLPFHNGREIRLADRPEDFACAVVELLNNDSARALMGAAARTRVCTKHSWQAVVSKMEEILEGVAWSGQQVVA